MFDMVEDKLRARQRLYTTVFCQCYSPCGKFLAVGHNFGQVAIFSLSSALSPDESVSKYKPMLSFKVQDGGPVYTLASTDKFLITGGTGDVQGWQWTDIFNKTPKVAWSLKLPTDNNSRFDNIETNKVVVSSTEDDDVRLLAGCGDSRVHIWSLSSGQLVTSLDGHTDYVHSLALRSSNTAELVSVGEDGKACVWDTRTPKYPMHVIEPYKKDECARPQHGRWLGCVAIDAADDWLVCGGGPSLSLWHLRSLSSTTVFDTPKSCQKHVQFYEDTIISGGSQPYVNHWFINGDLKSQIPTSPTSVYSIAVNASSDSNKVLTVAGSSHKIDVSTNFGYKAFSLEVL